MENTLRDWLAWLQAQSAFETVAACFLLLLAAWLTNFLMKRIIVRGVLRITRAIPLGADVQTYQSGIVRRLANIVPALVLILGVRLIPDLPPALALVIGNVGSAFIVLSIALVLGKVLDLALSVYNRRADAHLKPIKGYLQIEIGRAHV